MPRYRIHTAMIPLLYLLIIAPESAQGQQSVRRVGVVVTHQVNVTSAEARELALTLGEALGDVLSIDVIAGRDVERALPHGGLSQGCVARVECRLDLGRRLDADELLMLSITRVGSMTQIDSTWANVASGRVVTRPAIRLETGDDPIHVFTGRAAQLLPHIAHRRDSPRQPGIVIINPGDRRERVSPRRITRGTWIAGGVSAAALVAGGALALSARGKWNDLEAQGCRRMACPGQDIDALGSRALAADILLGAAVASGTAAAILYWRSAGAPRPVSSIDERSASHDENLVSPSLQLGPGALGVSVGGRF